MNLNEVLLLLTYIKLYIGIIGSESLIQQRARKAFYKSQRKESIQEKSRKFKQKRKASKSLPKALKPSKPKR